MADPATLHNLNGHLKDQIARLNAQLTQSLIDVAAWRAAEHVRIRRYDQILQTVGPPPEELTHALRTDAGGWRAAWIPFDATGLLGVFILLPGQAEPLTPYAEADVWNELATPAARHLTVVRDEVIPQIEHRDLPRPLIAYVRDYGAVSRIVIAKELEPEARAMAARAIWRMWRVHHPGRAVQDLGDNF